MQGDALKGITGGDYIKPSAFNPAGGDPTQQGAAVPQPIQIDPEVLNLYSQINPKMNLDLTSLLQSTLTGVQRPTSQANIPAFGISPESFLYGPVNLTVPELPGLPSEFFLHLISMFFTYFHPTMPIVREISFFENLIPINHHHQMLLNAIYAIGCHYSRHPMLYQAPFYTPQRASDFFMDRAFAAVPPPDSKHFISYESLAICQASLLLATCDFSLKRCRTWMMIGMGCRLVQKYELYYTQSQSDFFTVFNGRKKVHIPSPLQERKRVWWGALLSDLFVSISTGKPLLLNETEYIDTMVDTTKLIDRPVPKLAHGEQPLGLISTSSASKSTGSPGGEDLDKWKPFFSGFPKDTIFGPSDFTSDRWSKKSIGFFQVNHLFSSLDDTSHLVQLCFIVRRILRFLHAAPSIPSIHTLPTTTACMYSLIGTPVDVVRLHESLLVWYENLPVPFRLFHSLEALAAADPQDLGKFCSIKEGERVSGTVVTLNLLLFSAFALLHQRNAEATAINFEDDEAQSAQQPLSSTLTRSNASFINQPKSSVPIFRISSSLLGRGMFESSQIIAFMYKAQTHLIKSVYGASMPPSPTSVPPSEMVGSPIIGTLMMPTAVALLAQSAYARKLVSQTATTSTPGAMPAAASADDTTPVPGIEPISQSVLPVLDNISQVWSTAGEYATTLRGLVDKVRKRINTQTAPSVVGPDASATTDPWYQSFQARTVPLPRAPLGPASLEELIRNDTARTAGAGKTTNNASQMSSISASSSFIESLLQPGVAMTQSLDASSRAPSFQVPQAPSTQSSAAASTAAASDRNGHPQQLSQKSQSLTASQSQSQSQLLQHISSALNLSSSRPRIDPVVSMLLGQSAGAGRDTAKLSTDGAAGGVSDGATRAAAAAQQASQKEPSAATQAEGASGASQPAPGAGGVPAIPPAVAAAKEGMAQSWHDLRSEFEDEFLL
nr:hypothetical protein HK105_003840 [Polyrhizophydium stewartii]